MPQGSELFYVVLAGVAVALVVAMRFAMKGYGATLAAWACENGYDYVPALRFGKYGVNYRRPTLDGRYDDVWFRRYAAFFPFSSEGHNQRSYELCIKKHGETETRIFRFHSDGAGPHSVEAWHVWVCAVEGPWTLPTLEVRPQNLSDKVGGLLGRGSISTGDNAFDAVFHISGESENAARSFLNPELRKFLLDMGRYRWQTKGRFVMLTWPESYSAKDVELMDFAMRRFLLKAGLKAES